MLFRREPQMPEPDAALPGRATPIDAGTHHFVNGHPLHGPWPEGFETAVFAGGCYWGVEEEFWKLPGVFSTAVGYAGGFTPNPTYEEVCSGMTGHAEAVLVVFDPASIGYEQLLKTFWQSHDPTQGMGQGNDIGTQYRSAIYVNGAEQRAAATASMNKYQQLLSAAGYDAITTEIEDAGELDEFFFYAEPEHQQYLAKHPHGYRCHSATGVAYAG